MILMIDDEPENTNSYVDELTLSGYRVETKKSVDAGLSFLRENREQVELLILDIMMPPGRALAGVDTQNGLRSGVHLFGQIREMAPQLPIIILTNVSDERVAERFRQEKRCRFLHKEDYLPFELVAELQEFIQLQA